MKKSSHAKAGFVRAAGINVRYSMDGEGFPVIFVHGISGNIEQDDMGNGFIPRLGTRYRVIHYDCRGRGQSEAGGYLHELYTREGLADDLWALMKALGIRRAYFIGGSQGAGVVLALAAKRPEAVAAGVLNNPVDVRKLDPEYVRGMLEYADFIEQAGMDALTDYILSLPPHTEHRKTHPELIEWYEKIMRSQDARVIAAATRGVVLSEPIDESRLRRIRSPFLIIGSEGDGLHPCEVGRYLAGCLPRAETFFAPNMTYFSDNREMVPSKVMEFFSGLDKGSQD